MSSATSSFCATIKPARFVTGLRLSVIDNRGEYEPYHCGGTVGVVGNIDVDLLSRGTTDQVVAATREQLARISPSGGHLIGSGNSISSSVRGENFLAMIGTVQREGAYPISVSRVA